MLKQIEAGALSVGYEESGPPDGTPVVLLDPTDAELAFTTLMGDKVEPRRQFIEKHAKEVKNLDI